MSVNAYQRTAQLAADPRDTEYRAFGLAVARLMSANTPSAVAEAVHFNNRLWSTLASDLAMPSNALPTDMRAKLISLALWSIKYGSKVMRGEAEPSALIKVNKEIMAGLKRPTGEQMTEAALPAVGIAAVPPGASAVST